MPLPMYLAMTTAEIARCNQLPPKLSYMACHYSPYTQGLSNLPDTLPGGAMLIVNDSNPVCDHEPDLIVSQLQQLCERLHIGSVLLDFQRPGEAKTAAVVSAIADALDCPVGVSACYADEESCAVFLPPPPAYQSLQAHLAPWQGREVWVEIAPVCNRLCITETACRITEQLHCTVPLPHYDSCLHCHYGAEVGSDSITFTLNRDKSDLPEFLEEAYRLGVTQAIGLYQELADL